MHSTIVKKIFLLPTLLLVASLACTVQLTATTPTEIPATPLVVTVVFPTQGPAAGTSVPATAVPTQVPAVTAPATAVPTQVAPTQVPPTYSAPTPQPPVSAGTTVTYRPLTLVIPPGVASGASGRNFPRLDSDNAVWWEKTPGHLQVSLADYYLLRGKTHQPQIYVYPASDYALMLPAAFESIHRLQNYLYAPNNVPALDQLPGVPFFNAQSLFAAHIQPVAFQNGKGIRYLSEYAQYPASANNTDLFYNFIGVTSDGERYIVAIFPLTSPVLAETSDAGAPLPSGGIPYPYMANPQADMSAYYSAVTNLLNTQRPDNFTPSLNQLDALIQSMQVNP